jgi:hypothetical protein
VGKGGGGETFDEGRKEAWYEEAGGRDGGEGTDKRNGRARDE